MHGSADDRSLVLADILYFPGPVNIYLDFWPSQYIPNRFGNGTGSSGPSGICYRNFFHVFSLEILLSHCILLAVK